jgi:steroid 5-alpha reductase family enzyme
MDINQWLAANIKEVNMWPYINTFIFFNFFYLFCVSQRNFGLIDIAWGLSFIVYHLTQYMEYKQFGLQATLVLAMIMMWGLRLAIYLARRNLGKIEDFRYQNFRKAWGNWPNLNAYFRVFILQMVLMFIVSLPSYSIMSIPGSMKWYNWFGVAIWAFGFIWESWADATLAYFKKNKKGVCQDGPWKYSRHPNYFGEITLWWGIYLATLPSPWWGVFGPLTIHFMLIKVSGVPMLEEKYKDNPEYLKYIQETNALVPNIFKK